ncbi:hypothetical protein B7494_g7923 [Chlorociboria aeruginascens]|nr:hypothetical protein B7494_g7923 [Chlorociboria aeruginascens]
MNSRDLGGLDSLIPKAKGVEREPGPPDHQTITTTTTQHHHHYHPPPTHHLHPPAPPPPPALGPFALVAGKATAPTLPPLPLPTTTTTNTNTILTHRDGASSRLILVDLQLTCDACKGNSTEVHPPGRRTGDTADTDHRPPPTTTDHRHTE